jgi:hypothetical protein
MNEGVANFFAVITLMIGGGLVAIGLLSFMDASFFKSKLRDRAALAIGLAFLLATEALFVTHGESGRYLSGQKLDVTECEYQIESAFPNERRSNPRLVRDKIVACMDQLGYDWSDDTDHCREAPLATNVFCYLPKAALARRIVALQSKFE